MSNTRRKCDVSIMLFGSRKIGTARSDSDYDVLLVGEELARLVVPRPMPHDQPGFYDPKTPIEEHHAKKQAWSVQFWDRLGGDATVDQMRNRAIASLRASHGQIPPEMIDLFFYLPPDVSNELWAIRPVWTTDNAYLDFAVATARKHWPDDDELRETHRGILRSPGSIYARAQQIADTLLARTGIEVDDTYKRYASLSEVRRNFGRYAVETGMP